MRRLPAKLVFLALTLLLGALTVSCGSGGSSPAPTPNPSPVSPTPPGSGPSVPMPNLHGDWSGTLESPSFPTKTISARFVQNVDCVDGSWNTSPPDVRWIGAISGYAVPGALDGYMSFEIPGSGSRICSGVGTLVGDATDNATTLTWNVTAYDTDTCTSAPSLITLKLRRQ